MASDDLVDCCPADDCDSANIERVSAPSMLTDAADRTPAYRCKRCLARFDEPDERERVHGSRGLHGLAKELLEADSLEEVRIDG